MGRLTLVLGVALTMVSMTLSDAIGDWAVDSGGREHRKAEAAIRYFTEVIKSTEITRKNRSFAFYNRGNAYYDLGDFDRAILNFSQALQLNTDADVYYNQGNAYANLQRHDQAIQNYSWAIQLKPDYHYAYYNRANSYFWKGDYDNAMEDYRKAYELNPDETVYQKKVTDFGLIN